MDRRIFSRRDMLKIIGTAGAMAFLPDLPFGGDKNRIQAQDVSRDIDYAGIEAMTKEELLQAVMEYPVIPEVNQEVLKGIIDVSKEKGKRVDRVCIVGTSVASDDNLVDPFFGIIDLGQEFSQLGQIDTYYFNNSDVNGGTKFAVKPGMDVSQVVSQPEWCNKPECQPRETIMEALDREYTPGITINFFGNNALFESLEFFGSELEVYVRFQIERGTIPILTTFPHPLNIDEMSSSWLTNVEEGTGYYPINMLRYNLTIERIAAKYGLPVINVLKGVHSQELENHGTTEGFHFSSPEDKGRLSFADGDHKKYGTAYMNLLILQMLEKIYPLSSG